MKNIRLYLTLFFVCIVFFSCEKEEKKYTFDGLTQGTYYHIIIYSKDTNNIRQGFDSIFALVDNTLSLWNKNSLLTQINENKQVELNRVFIDNFNYAKQINTLTDGALDITIGALVQMYGFANKNKEKISEEKIDSLKTFIGMEGIRIENNRLIKNYKETQLDFNAIAQGYTTDMISKYLISRGITNFLVDVGGEVYCKGEKPNGKQWNVAIETPAEKTEEERTFETTIKLKDKSIVTSGNYRKFYVENGVKYSHTIDPKTARPVRHSLLSASAIANDATTADGLATAFMVMGLEKSKAFLKQHKEYAAYLIYSDENGKMQTWQSDNFASYLNTNQ
ncbi:MAG: FAD:protein FMN transferase [Bacteroidota bacterium]|nr:FAD:protein FMN transferase [Bacteroidota bacterium]